MISKIAKAKFDPGNKKTWLPLLTLDQAATILNVSKWALRKWDNDGGLKAIRIGSRKDRRYKKEAILKVLS